MTSNCAEVLSRAEIQPIAPEDNAAIAQIIRNVLGEFGIFGEGYACADPEVDAMYETYQAPRSRYFVVEQAGEVVGGGGVAPLKGADGTICELQKFYFLPHARGQGYGQLVIEECLAAAREFGFKQCYIETIPVMKTALGLYERNGFRHLAGPRGNTGHYNCDRWLLKDL